MKETDLYPPVKRFLESQGYDVKGEVKDCDVMAVRGEEDPVVVELKLSLNLTVVLQAVDRLAMTSSVYIGIPANASLFRKHRRQLLRMFRMLGLGLLFIRTGRGGGAVEVVLDPGEYRPRKSRRRAERLLGEFQHRVGDPNPGGMEKRRGVMTSYRQKALSLAEYLREHGPSRPAEIARSMGEPRARDILYKNVYGWFERVERGVYTLSPRGDRETVLWSGDAGK